MYIYLTAQNAVAEIIPDENPVFPGIPVEKRYAPDFVQKLLHVLDSTGVKQNWVYDPETEAFAPPPEPEMPDPGTDPDVPDPSEHTLSERVEALETETAALTAAVEKGLNL